MKQNPVKLSTHAREYLTDRGTTEQEIVEAIQTGERVEAKQGRIVFRKNFRYDNEWKGERYSVKQVKPIVAEEENELVVVTVYVYYIGEGM